MKRIISCILALVMVLSAVLLAGCSSGEKYQPLITYGTRSVSTNMFGYILSQAKTMALYSLGQTADAPEVWETDGGKILADYITEDAVSTAMSLVYYASAADAAGEKLTEEDVKKTEENLEALMTGYNVNKSGLNSIMANYGVNYDILKEYYSLQQLAAKGKSYVLGEGGSYPITDRDYLDYYNKNYVTLRHLNLNNINKVGANGKEVLLTDEEKAQVEAQAASIEAGLAAGQQLSEFAALSTDALLEAYPDGLTLPTENNILYAMAYAAEQEKSAFNVFGLYYYLLNNVEGFAETALAGEMGKVTRMDTDKGIFFVEKMPLNQDMFPLYKEIMKEDGSLEPIKTKELMKAKESEFVIDTATLDTFTVKGTAVIAVQ
ncbi:MAG: hypothetical protein E7588_06520 [Ruminococcaceae bacterium]|nr:hypothetical protein [Oscillospiraceae bacterium]